MGGNLDYQYLGQNANGDYDYKVTLTIYRLCDPGSTSLPTSMNLGAYEDDPLNPTGDKIRRGSPFTLPLITQTNIVPPSANANCTFSANVCVEEGVYQATITLPGNTTGYYLVSDRCCRNGNIANVFDPGNTGQAYFISMPAPSLGNNSPAFSTAPVPYLCAGDTFSILNQAFDLDNDSLVYHFATPYAGISSQASSNPTPPATYPWPITPITYAANYSINDPFGPGGSATIDSTTGLASYYSLNQGFYVIAVEVSEYRNGVLIGVMRRDLQIIVVSCPVNPAPQLATGSTQTTFTMQEGQSLCFNIAMTDANGDSIFLTHSGNIFNPLLTSPAATLSDTSGPTPIQTQFCWTTSCNQGRTVPYQFSVSSSDNGCPAKTTNIVYTINVQNTITPALIFGPDTLCENAATGINYSVGNNSGYTYNWIVNQGTQVSGGTGNAITVDFNNAANASIRVVAINPYGCPSDTVTKQILVKPQPAAIAGSDKSYCSGSTVTIGAPSQSGLVYSWSPSTGLSDDSISNPVVNLINSGTAATTTTYILTTTANGCSNKDTVDVTVRPVPVAAAGANQLLCSGSQITLGTSTTGGYQYLWNPSGGLSSDTISNPFLTLINTDTVPDTLNYIVVVTNSFTCTASDTVRVVVSPIPVPDAGSDVIFCSGLSASIGTPSQFGFAYAWTPASGVNPANNSQATLTLTNSTTVFDTVQYILASTRYGCTGRDTLQAIVKPNPIAEAGNPLNACDQDTVQIGTSSTSGYTYSWSPATGLSDPDSANPFVFITSTGSPVSTTYTVTVTSNGCISVDSVTVTSNPLPAVTASTLTPTVCQGTPATLTASGANNYSWSTLTAPGTVIGTGGSITVNPNSSTSYIVTGISSAGCINKDTIALTVAPIPAVSITSVSDSICAGDSVTLSGNGALNYSWTLLGSSTVISTQPQITVNPLVPTSYVVTGTDASLCSNKDTLQVRVNPAATADSILGNTSVCPGVSGVSYWVPSANQSSTYSWIISNGIILTGQGNDSITTSWDSSATGYLQVFEMTDRGCTSDTISLPVSVNVILTPSAPTGTGTFCSDQAVGVQYQTSSTPGSVYNWFIQGGNIVSGNGTDIVTVDWTVNNGTGAIWFEETSTTIDTVCFGVSDTLYVTISPSPQTSSISGQPAYCLGDTATFSVNNTNNSTYSWTGTNTNILTGNSTYLITSAMNLIAGPAQISVTETNSFGCTGSAVVLNFTVNALPNANAGSSVAICSGDSTRLQASGGIQYQWTPVTGLDDPSRFDPWANPTATTNYTVLVTDVNTCKNTAQVTVTVNPLPNVSAGTNVSICLDKNTTLNATGANNYVWSPVTGLNDPNSQAPIASPTATTIYTVVGTDLNNCTASSTVTVTVNALPAATASNDTSICDNSTIYLNAGGGQSYGWTPTTGLNDPALQQPAASPHTTTTYTVTVTDINGCTDTEDVLVSVNLQPVSDFDIDPMKTKANCDGVSQTFINRSTNADNYLWDLGSSFTTTDEEPTYLYPFGSSPEIILISYNNFCSDTLRKNINNGTVADFVKNVPNVFTPNNDGINDCYDLGSQNEFYGCSSWKILNRWGETVFESKQQNDCWNGKRDSDGSEMPAGTYFYLVKIKDSVSQGTVLLTR